MNARAIAFIAFRLFAVYLLITHVFDFALQVVVAFALGSIAAAGLRWTDIVAISGATAFYALLAAVFWFGASLLARVAAKPFPEKFGEDIGFDRWQALAITAVGWLVMLRVVEVAGQAVKQLMTPYSFGVPDFDIKIFLVTGGFYLLASLVLIFGAQRIVDGLKGLRAWGTKPLITEDEQ